MKVKIPINTVKLAWAKAPTDATHVEFRIKNPENIPDTLGEILEGEIDE